MTAYIEQHSEVELPHRAAFLIGIPDSLLTASQKAHLSRPSGIALHFYAPLHSKFIARASDGFQQNRVHGTASLLRLNIPCFAYAQISQ